MATTKERLVKYLGQNMFITLGEARKLGVAPMMLSRLVANEEIHRISHGIYATNFDWLTDPLKKYVVACKLYPKAVICGVSALSHYDLTDEEERKTWIALPVTQVIHNFQYRVLRLSGNSYSLGIQTVRFGRRIVRIYDREKTVVDAFKHLPRDVAMKALKRYMKRKDKNVKKLCDYGRKMKKPLDNLVAAIWSDE